MSCFSYFSKSAHTAIIFSLKVTISLAQILKYWGEIWVNTTHSTKNKEGLHFFLTNFPENHIVKINNQKILKIGRSDRKSEFRRNGSKIGRTPPKSEE